MSSLFSYSAISIALFLCRDKGPWRGCMDWYLIHVKSKTQKQLCKIDRTMDL